MSKFKFEFYAFFSALYATIAMLSFNSSLFVGEIFFSLAIGVAVFSALYAIREGFHEALNKLER